MRRTGAGRVGGSAEGVPSSPGCAATIVASRGRAPSWRGEPYWMGAATYAPGRGMAWKTIDDSRSTSATWMTGSSGGGGGALAGAASPPSSSAGGASSSTGAASGMIHALNVTAAGSVI
jgi:hypothetical protein